MTKKKIKEVPSNQLESRPLLQKKMSYSFMKDFHQQLLKTGRDCSVQRESVWRDIPGKQSRYMSAIAQGYSDTSTFHFINLIKSVEILQPQALKSGNIHELNFIEHMNTFIHKGNEWVHIDGGNRSDSIIDWYDNKIALQPGLYVIMVDGERKMITLNKEDYYTYENLSKEYPEMLKWMDEQTFSVIEYSNLSREERRSLFERLNDNENVTREEYRNCSTSNICTDIRNLNYEYRDLFVLNTDSKSFVVKKNAERYKFCAWIASLNNFYTYEGKVDAWSSKNLDLDYESNSVAEQSMESFTTFFEDIFIGLVKYIGDFSGLKNSIVKKSGTSRNRLIDLYCALVLIYKQGGELSRLKNNKLDYKSFVQTYLEWNDPKWKDETPCYSTSTSAYTFGQLYGANTAYKMKYRLDFITTEFIPLLEERKLIVTKDKKRFFPQEWRRQLWSKQDGKCAISGEAISITDVENGEIVHIDHIVPHSKGGQTIMENAQLVYARYNLEKSNKYDAA